MRRGIWWALLAAWIYTTMGLIVKFGAREIPNEIMVWARQLFGFCTLLPILTLEVRSNGPSYLKTDHLRLHVVRTLASLAAGYCLFFALKMLPLAEAIVLSNTRALFIPIYAWIIFGKRIELTIWACLGIAFIGVVLVLQPGKALLELPAVIGLLAGAFGGGAFLSIRRLNKVEPANRIPVYYFFLSALLASVPLMWAWEPLDFSSWMVLILIGVMAAAYQSCLTRAYRTTRASIIGGVLQTALLFSVAYDWIFYRSAPGAMAIIGMVLIAGASAWIIAAARPRPQEG